MKNKNIAINSSNRFMQVQEELKNLLSIIMGTVEASAQEEQDFEYFMQSATSEEERMQIQALKDSTQNLNMNAQIFQKNVGTTTHKMQSRTSKSTTSSKEPTTFNEIKPITQKPIEHIHRIDDLNSER